MDSNSVIDEKERRRLGLAGKISIATLILLGSNFFYVTWWASDLTRRVSQLEIIIEKQSNQAERLAVIEANVAWIRAELERARGK